MEAGQIDGTGEISLTEIHEIREKRCSFVLLNLLQIVIIYTFCGIMLKKCLEILQEIEYNRIWNARTSISGNFW